MTQLLSKAALRRLQHALDERATAKSRDFWTRYLKGTARFRGVPMAGVRDIVHAWWRDEKLASATIPRQKAIARRLIEEPFTEDKLAGVLALAEILLPHLDVDDLPALAMCFDQGHIADWNLCDWFCVKVLAGMLDTVGDPIALAQALSEWREGETLWQRRASCVAFIKVAPKGHAGIANLSDVIIDNCAVLVQDSQRFAQTGVGWVLRELSVFDKPRVVAFAQRFLAQLSREALQSLTKKWPDDERITLLDHHRTLQRSHQ